MNGFQGSPGISGPLPRPARACGYRHARPAARQRKRSHRCAVCSRLAAAYALRGETERAAAELAEARRLDGGDLFSSITHLKAFPGAWQGVPKIRALYESTYFAGLRKAGMPEE